MKKSLNSPDPFEKPEFWEEGVFTGALSVWRSGYIWADGSSVGDEPQDSGPWLVVAVDPDLLKFYAVMRRGGLLTDFLQLSSDPKLDRIRRFSNRYGFLYNYEKLSKIRLEPPVVSRFRQVTWGMSMGSWLKELSEFRRLYELWTYLRIVEDQDSFVSDRVQKSRHQLQQMLWQERRSLTKAHQAWRARKAVRSNSSTWRSGIPDEDLIEEARRHVFAGVGIQLRQGIALSFSLARGRDMTFRNHPTCLLGAIYLQFGREVVGQRRAERSCQFSRCLRPFIPLRRHKRYCGDKCRNAAVYERKARFDGNPVVPIRTRDKSANVATNVSSADRETRTIADDNET